MNLPPDPALPTVGVPALADTATRLRLGIFKLNGLLLQDGELMLDGVRLSPARARLLGVIERAGQPLSTPQICHELGQSRQGVGRLVGLMVDDGLLALQDNPLHQTSRLIALTPLGRQAYGAALDYHLRLSNKLPLPVDPKDLETTCRVIDTLIKYLESSPGAY